MLPLKHTRDKTRKVMLHKKVQGKVTKLFNEFKM